MGQAVKPASPGSPHMICFAWIDWIKICRLGITPIIKQAVWLVQSSFANRYLMKQ